MSSKIDVPTLLTSREPFGDSMVQLITAVCKEHGDPNDLTLIFPDKDYSNLEVEVKLNGVEVPAEILKEIFFRHAHHFAQVVTKQSIHDLFEPMRDNLDKLNEIMDDASSKIIESSGLKPEDYDDRW